MTNEEKRTTRKIPRNTASISMSPYLSLQRSCSWPPNALEHEVRPKAAGGSAPGPPEVLRSLAGRSSRGVVAGVRPEGPYRGPAECPAYLAEFAPDFNSGLPPAVPM